MCKKKNTRCQIYLEESREWKKEIQHKIELDLNLPWNIQMKKIVIAAKSTQLYQ